MGERLSKTRTRCGGLAVIGLILGASLVPARAEVDASRVQVRAESEGPTVALELSSHLLDAHPSSIGLLLQHAELLVEVEGAIRAHSLIEQQRSMIPSANVEIALAFCEMSTGRTNLARRRWSTVQLDTLEFSNGFDRWSVEFQRRDMGVPADSVDVLEERLQEIAGELGSPWTLLTDARLAAIHARERRRPQLLAELPASLAWTRARLLLLRARLFAYSGALDQAEADYRRSWQLADAIQARRTAALARSYCGALLDDQLRFDGAARVRKEAVAVFESLQDSIALAYAVMGLGWDLENISDTSGSISASSRAAKLWQALGNRWGQIQSLNNLGVAHFDADQWTSAQHRFQQALDLLESAPNSGQRRMVLNNVALLEARRGRPDLAVEIDRELLALHRQAGNAAGEKRVLNNLGLACLQLGESEQAREYFRLAIETKGDEEHYPTEATTNLAMILADEGDLDGADELLAAALPFVRRVDDRDGQATVLAWRGRIRQRQGKSEEACMFLERADSLYALRGSSGVRIATLVRLASAQLQAGELAQARRTASLARDLDRRLKSPVLTAATACLVAITAQASGDCEAARAAARQAWDAWFDELRKGESEQDRSDISAASTEAIRVLARCSRMQGTSEADFGELAGLADAVLQAESRPLRPRAGADLDSLSRRERELRDRMETCQGEVGKNPNALEARWALADAETAWHALRRRIAALERYDPAIQAFDMSDLASAVEGSTFLAYLMGPGVPGTIQAPVIRLWVDDRHAQLDLLDDEARMRRRVRAWMSLVSRPSPTPAERRAEVRLARELGRELLPPALRRAMKSGPLVIAADGVLASMSFAALVAADSSATRLVERFPIERVRSWTQWNRLASASHSTPLSGWVRADPTALEAAVRGDGPWPRAAVLHIDSHGYFDRRRPWLSGLYAGNPRSAPDRARPFLQQADLALLHLDHDLVTLAACETARGEDSPLRLSVASFAGAMQDAGARAVLGSAWEVEADLAKWTTDKVYDELAAGRTISSALRSAQVELLHNPDTADPFYWGGWRVMGDGAQRIHLESRHAPTKARAWGLLSLLLLALAFVLWRRSTSTG